MAKMGRRVQVSLTGALMPWNKNTEQPVFFQVAETDDLFIVIFSRDKIDELKDTMKRNGWKEEGWSIKQINDGSKFLSGLACSEHVRIMYNPWITEKGNTRWVEVIIPGLN